MGNDVNPLVIERIPHDPPYPGENGNWFVCDPETGEYVDSGEPASREGQAGTIESVEAITIESDQPAEVENTGTKLAAKLRFKIPQGKQGKPGPAAPNTQAQYSADKDNWHDEFQEGDLWQRLSYDKGKTWGNPMPTTMAGMATGGNADTLHGKVPQQVVEGALHGYGMKEVVIDASALDQNTYYPVTIPLTTNGTWKRIDVVVALNSGTTPAWSTHELGFSCCYMSKVQGAIHEVSPEDIRQIEHYSYQHIADAAFPIIGNMQMMHSGTEVIFVRGGGRYYFYTSHDLSDITLRSSAYTLNGETAAPISLETARPVMAMCKKSFLYADATISINGESKRLGDNPSFNVGTVGWTTGNLANNTSGVCEAKFKVMGDQVQLRLYISGGGGNPVVASGGFKITNLPTLKNTSKAMPAGCRYPIYSGPTTVAIAATILYWAGDFTINGMDPYGNEPSIYYGGYNDDNEIDLFFDLA